MNLKDVLAKERLSFLQLTREMMTEEVGAKQTRRPRCLTARISDEEDLDEKNRDDDYIPRVVRKSKRTRRRTTMRASGSDEPVMRSTKKERIQSRMFCRTFWMPRWGLTEDTRIIFKHYKSIFHMSIAPLRIPIKIQLFPIETIIWIPNFQFFHYRQ